MSEKHITKTQKRLYKLFKEIKDEDIREIVIEVVNTELVYRSSHNFPIRKVRDAVDSVARKQDLEEERKEGKG